MLPLAEEEAGLRRGEMEAQRDPRVRGRPSWGEVRESVHSSDWSDIRLLKAGAGPGNPQLSGSCRPSWTAPQPHHIYGLAGCLPVPTSSGSRDCEANRYCPGRERWESSLYLTIECTACGNQPVCAVPTVVVTFRFLMVSKSVMIPSSCT